MQFPIVTVLLLHGFFLCMERNVQFMTVRLFLMQLMQTEPFPSWNSADRVA
jgi:hypothetical protein